MQPPEREIPQRELRNDVARVLREVEAGARMTVTVGGRPVAMLGPVPEGRPFVPRDRILEIVRSSPLDDGFPADVGSLTGATIEDL